MLGGKEESKMNDSKPAPVSNLDVLIVGAGLAGLYMLFKVRQKGLTVRLIEAASGVGGTWYFNRYPGARVDVESREYSFGFSEQLQQEWRWTERYASQPELLRYANHVADRFAMRDGIQLNTRVTGARYDETTQRWNVSADTGETWLARFLVMASGPLSSPNTPAFKGLETFAGPVYHTARWPKETVDFTGQRVGIVGTGSSAVQAIPLIARQASELTVFQRTATYAVPAHNAPLDPAYEARIKADYAGFRARNRREIVAFGSEKPMNPVSALAVSPEEREATFEERWRIGGFSLLFAFNDILTDARLATSPGVREARSVRSCAIRKPPASCHRCIPSAASACASTPGITKPSIDPTCGWST
jgi:cyclohexanone monooxygenase